MALHSSQTSGTVRLLDVLITVGVLSATMYLFMSRLEFTRAAEAAALEMETTTITADQNIQDSKSTTTVSKEELLQDPPPDIPAKPAAQVDSVNQDQKEAEPEKPAKPVKAAVKPKPTTPAPPDPTPLATQNYAPEPVYKPRGFQRRGFSRKGFSN